MIPSRREKSVIVVENFVNGGGVCKNWNGTIIDYGDRLQSFHRVIARWEDNELLVLNPTKPKLTKTTKAHIYLVFGVVYDSGKTCKLVNKL